ncbi:50S ribosomal protein L25 [Patescibacteria group bacterium]|nr:50S ribosomal protein L25 [Patescibacteria group bacterium]MBU0963745.1 50S ribosomal protein L25 [Patescibacteria group bacterium]
MSPNSEVAVLRAELRQSVGKKVDTVRQQGKIPAVLYGREIKNVNLFLDYRTFEIIYKEVGGSSLVDLQIDKQKPVKVLIHDIQRDPVTNNYIHADFYQVKMTEKITAEVAISFIGESRAVKESGGIMVKNLTSAKIEALPQDLVKEIEVDITSLKTFEDIIRVKDLKFPPGITIKEKMDRVVVKVQPPRTEEELKALEEKPEEKVDDIEKIGEKKEEGEEAEATGDDEVKDKPKDDKAKKLEEKK